MMLKVLWSALHQFSFLKSPKKRLGVGCVSQNLTGDYHVSGQEPRPEFRSFDFADWSSAILAQFFYVAM